MIRPRPALALTAVATLALSLTSCSTGEDVQIKPQEEIKEQVLAYAEKARVAAGSEVFPQANTNVSACEGRAGELSDPESVYYIQGIYQLSVPAERQLDALDAVRQAWERDGHTIKTQRTFLDGKQGEVVASGADGFELSLTSGNPPAMLLMVASPCYRAPK